MNWCPAQNTVLANEEVKDGRYIETGDPVVQRPMRQWMLRITAYADRLLADLDGLDWPEGIKALQRHWIGRAETVAADGTRRVTYRLRDWLFSRQRYWGEPIPMLHLADGSVVPLPEDSLPLLPPELDDYAPAPGGEPPLARATDWVETTVPGTDIPARRETDTMPQWAGSCWYYLRFLDPDNDRAIVSREAERYWLPVDLYVGGAEHGVLHLLYARFWHKVLYDIGVVSTPEPFRRLVNQGMILAPSYRDAAGRYYEAAEVEERDGGYYAGSVPLARQAEKMSKSRFNVVNPDAVVAEHGADALRLYEMALGPLEAAKPWQTDGVAGIRRFLDRAWRIVCAADDRLSPAVREVAPPAGAAAAAPRHGRGGHRRHRGAALQHRDRPADAAGQGAGRRRPAAARGGAGFRAAAGPLRPAHRRGAVAQAGPSGQPGPRPLARLRPGPGRGGEPRLRGAAGRQGAAPFPRPGRAGRPGPDRRGQGGSEGGGAAGGPRGGAGDRGAGAAGEFCDTGSGLIPVLDATMLVSCGIARKHGAGILEGPPGCARRPPLSGPKRVRARSRPP